MGALPGLTGVIVGAGRGPFSLTYGSVATIDLPSSTHSFTGMTIGAAPTGVETRHIVVSIGMMHNSGAGTVSSVTVGGISATLVVTRGSVSAGASVWIYIAEVPTGATATVTIAMSGATSLGAATYILRNRDTTTATVSSTAQSPSLNLNIAAGGAAIGVSMVRDGTVSTWTGLTENFDTDTRSGEWFSGASGGTPGTPATISISRGSASHYAAAVASFA